MCADVSDDALLSDKILKEASQHRPSYRVIPVLNTPEISGGDDIVIEVYFSGYGIPEKAKLHVVYSGIELPETGPVTIKTAVNSNIDSDIGDDEENSLFVRAGGDATSTDERGDTKHLIYIPDLGLFYPTDQVFGDKSTGFASPPSYSELEYPDSSATRPNISPITLRIPTKTDHAPGDYDIALTLTTTDDYGNVFTTKENVTVRVQDWVEANNKMLRRSAIGLAIIATAFAALSFLLDIVEFLWDWSAFWMEL